MDAGRALTSRLEVNSFSRRPQSRVSGWDDLGWFAYQEDLGRYPDLESEYARRRQSLFEFYCEEGKVFGFTPGRAATYAMNRIGVLKREGRQLNPQVFIDLEATIERTKENSSP